METEKIRKIKDFFLDDRYAVLSGIELIDVTPGWAKTKMEIRTMHLNAGNVVQGGAIFTLADLAFAAAVNAYGNLALGIQTNINYFKSASEGTLFAEARIVNLHRKLAYFQVDITNDKDELIAVFTATAYRKEIPLPFNE
ncbi:MAG: PaaI family thioesterase [Dysgonamonadaceae bacterium]|jgi:acyl-CoA thioesterase|nr:PaaI family thioesterase [Dysgonamonadaceae bacterium]